MSRAGDEAGEVESPHPRTTSLLIGHAAGERTLLGFIQTGLA